MVPVIVALAVAGSASAVDPFKPSQKQQIELGLRAAGDLRKQEKVLPSSDEKVKTLRRVGRRLLNTVDGKNEPWQYSFDVIDSKEVNAFALPGGPVFFYTGLLDKLKTEDELAGVLAHELTHVRREHWAYAYRDSQKRNLLLNLGLIFAHANRNVADLASISNNLLFDLPFSRSHESEADTGGFAMMVDAGYNPEGMADVFELLQKEAKGGNPPEFFSDHPNDKNRINKIREMIQERGGSYPALKPLPWSS
ncbi:M48 family metallopeptidase [soil metagenome]